MGAVVRYTHLCHLLPVGLGVEGGLSEQGGVLLGGHTELIVEGVMPDLTRRGGREELVRAL